VGAGKTAEARQSQFPSIVWTNLLRSPNSHSNLAMQPDHSCALSSLVAPDITNYSTASSSPSFARSLLGMDHSDVEASSSRRRRRCEEGGVGKTVWRW
jgi:hypothetical protein